MSCLIRQSRIAVLLIILGAVATPVAAQVTYHQSISLGADGTVDYQVTVYSHTCTYDNGHETGSYLASIFGSFVFLPASGGTVPITGGFETITGSNQQGDCPKNQDTFHITYLATKYQVYIYTISQSPGITAAYVTGTPGYINPKYIVATVLYAPPGSRSTAVYTNSNTVSNTTSLTNTFTTSTTISTSTMVGLGLDGYQAGSETGNQSTTETETSSSGTSVTATLTTTSGLTVPGPVSDYVGVDHDYDIIKVWINPVMPFTVYNTSLAGETKVGWFGYGYSALDPTAPIDIWGIPAGCLNGDFSTTESACSAPLGAFERTWAAGEKWPSGQGPGLTQTDLDNILAADPWGKCSPSDPVGSAACPTYSSGFILPNFSLSDQTEMPYTQPLPGGQPSSNQYSVSTTSAATDTESTGATYSQTWGYENVASLTQFIVAFSGTLSESYTMTWSYQFTTATTESGTKTGTANVTGPACDGNPCDPSYPPSPLTFGTGTAFDLFIDARFGTFAFVPSAYN